MSAYPKPCEGCERVTSDRAECVECGSPVATCERCAGGVVRCPNCDGSSPDCACGPDHDCRSEGCAEECEACNA